MISAWPARTLMGFNRFDDTRLKSLRDTIAIADPEGWRRPIQRRPIVLSATHLLVETLDCGQYNVGASDTVLLHVVLIRNERIEIFYELVRGNDPGAGEIDLCDAEIFIDYVTVAIAHMLGIDYALPNPLSV